MSYINILDKVVLPDRRISKEGSGRFKIYLPTLYNLLWEKLHEEKVSVDVVIIIKKEDKE